MNSIRRPPPNLKDQQTRPPASLFSSFGNPALKTSSGLRALHSDSLPIRSILRPCEFESKKGA